MTKITVGEKIKQLRVKNNVVQTQLAEHLSVTSGAISNWETNRRLPSIEELKAIASYFQVSLNYFSDQLEENTQHIASSGINEFKKQILIHSKEKWFTVSANRFFLYLSVFGLFISGFFHGDFMVFVFFIGFYAFIVFLVNTYFNRAKESHVLMQVNLDVKVIYLHLLSNQDLRKKKVILITLLSLVMSCDIVYFGLVFIILNQISYFFVILILISFFFSLIILNYSCFAVLTHHSSFHHQIDYDDVSKNFRFGTFDFMILIHIIGLLSVSVISTVCLMVTSFSVLLRISLVLSLLSLIMSYIMYLKYDQVIRDYELKVIS